MFNIDLRWMPERPFIDPAQSAAATPRVSASFMNHHTQAAGSTVKRQQDEQPGAAVEPAAGIVTGVLPRTAANA